MAGRSLYPDETDENGPMLVSEAEGVIEEIKFAVSSAAMSQKLPCSEDLVYFNVTTQENCSYCVELSVNGFRIVGRAFDTVEAEEASPHFETIYALLDTVSPGYRQSFCRALTEKLAQLQDRTAE